MPDVEPQAPLGHLARLGFALVGAHDVDEIAGSLLTDLVALPGVRRVGFALSEGGGRRLRFTASDRDRTDGISWCHIDAYDDVPLTAVVRTGEAILGDRTAMARRFSEHVGAQPVEVHAMAVVPLPGIGSPIGGIALYLDQTWAFGESQRRWFDATARRTAEALRRVRATATPTPREAEHQSDPDSSVRATFEDHPSSAGMARRFLREFLLGRGVPEDVMEIAQLCLSELVTNAVMHSGGRSELVVGLEDDRLRVSVRDGGAVDPAEVVPDADADPLRVHGRGLQLVDALADRWGSERDLVGTTVWFDLELEGHHRPRASETG